jgi:prolyl oligopeptidase PreP (S9A serine peptidase family)
MIHPITPNIANTAVYYGATLAADKNSAPKTTVTNSSASASARGVHEDIQVGITSSSAKELANGTPGILERNKIKNITPPETIAIASVAVNTPSVNASVNLKAESEKEIKETKAGKAKESPAVKAKEALQILASQERGSPSIITLKSSISPESVLAAYRNS